MASKKYQQHIMDQFAKNFSQTKILMRYPADDENYHYVKNSQSQFGYHDDSFAWATINTGQKKDSWFFLAAMEKAGTLDAWKTRMIGGEIRPEIWGCVFDEKSCAPRGQEFDKCVQQTHATWLLDTGMFGKDKQSPARIANAKTQIAKMGYELHIGSITLDADSNKVTLKIENRGVAPFYYDWPAKIAVVGGDKSIRYQLDQSIQLPSILPGPAKAIEVKLPRKLKKDDRIAIRIPSPVNGGKPLRFANVETELRGQRWVVVPE